MKIQIYLILLKCFNILVNFIPLHSSRKIILNILKWKIGRKSYLHPPIKFFSLTKKIIIGNNVTINPNCYLDNRRGIIIGDNVNISHNVKIYTLGHDIDDPYFSFKGGTVVIENDVVIFANCLIMPGIKIGKGSVVYPGSVVTKSIPEFSVVGGNPAKILRERKTNIKYVIDNGKWFVL